MCGLQHGAGFRVCGAVIRRFVNQKHTFAALTLEVVGHPRSKKIEFRAFAPEIVEEIEQLGAGQTVEVTGSIDPEGLKDKKGQDVKVDGYTKWINHHTIRAIKVEGASRRPAPAPASTNGTSNGTHAPPPSPGASWNDDNVDF